MAAIAAQRRRTVPGRRMVGQMTDPLGLRVYETVVYAADVDRTTAFYRDVLQLRQIDGPDERSAALRLGDASVLLIFDPARSSVAGRGVPAHGAVGAGHIAFGVSPGALSAWRRRLSELGVALEQEQSWGDHGESLYFRDPAGNSVELVEGEIWAP
jgi:catechol 2,3-dioxygenase-like lactoylglutathione lyase family enzyme